MSLTPLASTFEIRTAWLHDAYGLVDASVAFAADDRILNVAYDRFAETRRLHSDVSALELALWFCDHWWRLMTEADDTGRPRSIAWRLAHELSSAGGGSAWPPMRFASDGQLMHVEVDRASSPLRPADYLEPTRASVPLGVFESAVGAFIRRVIVRGQAREADAELLDQLAHNWAEVEAERQDPQQRRIRELEALMGVDPESYSVDELDRLLTPLAWGGERATREVLAVLDGEHLQRDIGRVVSLRTPGGLGVTLDTELTRLHSREATPLAWLHGAERAAGVRSVLGNPMAPLTNAMLGDLLGVTVDAVDQAADAGKLLVGLAATAVETGEGAYDVRVRGRHPAGRRFKLARALGDVLMKPVDERLAPATTAATYRQKANRAFAQELLLPGDALRERVDGQRITDDLVEDVASEFMVSETVVQATLVNKGIVSAESFPWLR